MIYTYCSKKIFDRIQIGIRKVIKAAGMRNTMHGNDVYSVSMKISPEDMAIKQIIQHGIKQLNLDQIRNNRYLIPVKDGESYGPFWTVFRKNFNILKLEIRKYLIETYDKNDKNSMLKIKEYLKKQFMSKISNRLSPDEIIKKIFRNRRLKEPFNNVKKPTAQKRKPSPLKCNATKRLGTSRSCVDKTKSKFIKLDLLPLTHNEKRKVMSEKSINVKGGRSPKRLKVSRIKDKIMDNNLTEKAILNRLRPPGKKKKKVFTFRKTLKPVD